MSKVLTTPVDTPLPADESSTTASAVRPTLPVAVEVVDGFQQISESGRAEVLRQCHIASESSWWRSYHPVGSSGSTAFDRARARERAAGGAR